MISFALALHDRAVSAANRSNPLVCGIIASLPSGHTFVVEHGRTDEDGGIVAPVAADESITVEHRRPTFKGDIRPAVGAGHRERWDDVSAVLGVIGNERLPDPPLIGLALDLIRDAPRLVEGGKQDRQQNGDDPDDDEELDEGEALDDDLDLMAIHVDRFKE